MSRSSNGHHYEAETNMNNYHKTDLPWHLQINRPDEGDLCAQVFSNCGEIIAIVVWSMDFMGDHRTGKTLQFRQQVRRFHEIVRRANENW